MKNLQPKKCPVCGSEPKFQHCDTDWYVGYCKIYACDFPYKVGGVTEQAAIAKWNEVVEDYMDTRSYLK